MNGSSSLDLQVFADRLIERDTLIGVVKENVNELLAQGGTKGGLILIFFASLVRMKTIVLNCSRHSEAMQIRERKRVTRTFGSHRIQHCCCYHLNECG